VLPAGDRARFAAGVSDAEWPDPSDRALLATLEEWLAPFLGGMSRLAHLPQTR
jgi:ATP-dependent helicase HrpB